MDGIRVPVIVLNLKAYESGSNGKAIELIKVCEKASEKHGLSFVPCVQATDLHRCSQTSIPVFSQHFDPVEYGAHTGSVTVKAVKENKAAGSLINHSEKRIGLENIGKCIRLAKEHCLVSLCCVENLEEAEKVLKFRPDFIAYEDPVLIGSGKSITQCQPEEIKRFVEIVGNKSVPLTGAGVSSAEDVRKALELGTKGVLMASAFAKSSEPEIFLEKIAEAVKLNRKYF